MHKKILFSASDAKNILKDFTKQLKVKSSKKGLTIQASSGEGTIKTFTLPNGIIVLQMISQLKNAIKLDFSKLNQLYILTYKKTTNEKGDTNYSFYLGNEKTNSSTEIPTEKTKLIQIIFEPKVLLSYFTQKQIQTLIQNALLQNATPKTELVSAIQLLANEILFYDHTSFSHESFLQTRITEMMEIFIIEITTKQPLPV